MRPMMILCLLLPLVLAAERVEETFLKNLEKGVYTGAKMTFRLSRMSVADAVRSITAASGMTFRVGEEVSGEVHLEMVDVPWDRALASLLRERGLKLRLEGRVFRVENIKKEPSPPAGKQPEKGTRPIGPVRDGLPKKSSKYKGEPGDFFFKDADLVNVILFFAREYKLNVVIDPGIQGKVTISLKQVPWDQALEIILIRQGLVMVNEGPVIRALRLRDVQ